MSNNAIVLAARKAFALDPSATVPIGQISGTGSAATHPASDFDASGAANTVQGNLNTHTARTDNPHSVTKAQVGLGNVANALQLVSTNNLSDVGSAATARTNLGLGTLAVLNSGTANNQIPVISGGVWNAGTNVLEGGRLLLGTTSGTNAAIVLGDALVYALGPNPPTSPTVSSQGPNSGGNYLTGNGVSYQLWSYKFIRGVKYFSTPAVDFSFTATDDLSSLLVSWTAASGADGYVLFISWDGTYVDVGNVTSYVDHQGGGTAINTSRVGGSVLVADGNVTASGTATAAALVLSGTGTKLSDETGDTELSSGLKAAKRIRAASYDYGTASGSVSIDANLAEQINLTLVGDVTLVNPSNLQDGDALIYRATQNATGGWHISLDTAFSDPGSAAASVNLRSGSNVTNYLSSIYNGTSGKLDVMPDLGVSY